jgi:hypothetical protein
VSGLPVLQMAAFGREVSVHWDSDIKSESSLQHCDYSDKGRACSGRCGRIHLGGVYHMGNEEKLPVCLDKKNLASHVFVTGSTGSGKSNTVYRLLRKIMDEGGKFLVIEPAKGEYKNVFAAGGKVLVYGTNPYLSRLLRINPFKFPDGDPDPAKNIHILEHLERLVEIFNVCWPMEQAMPAVLKQAVEKAYEKSGWDLPSSTNIYSPARYPCFKDVAVCIEDIINSSEYSADVKGNYKGALIIRLKSLSAGIDGMIFTDDDLADEDLFDENVIVDHSRVGSMETKALIMGILVMKLQQYRQTGGAMNADLRHVTVLEEAHNLLKRTSAEQHAGSANLIGKSVEMLANAIAEMRTYGEGFIISDQSPGLLDLAVIRNTNTKIIMHLPDESDRELVGRSAGLNDEQIIELAKLQRGVAAVYQKDWILPVLCKVEKVGYDENPSRDKPEPDTALVEKLNAAAEKKKQRYAESSKNCKNKINDILPLLNNRGGKHE